MNPIMELLRSYGDNGGRYNALKILPHLEQCMVAFILGARRIGKTDLFLRLACDLYQQVVGEMGRNRRDYLYEMEYWEIVLIIRGYRRRNILQYQLQRQQIFASTFAFAGNKDNKKPEDLVPMYFDYYIDMSEEAITEEEQNELLDEIAEINALNEQNQNQQQQQ